MLIAYTNRMSARQYQIIRLQVCPDVKPASDQAGGLPSLPPQRPMQPRNVGHA